MRGPRRTAIAPAAATGTWKTKIARQSKASVSAPPTAGPSAVANTAAPSHSRRPGPAPPSRSKTVASPAAAPTAWAQRATSRPVRSSAPAHAALATAKSAKPPAPTARTDSAEAARSNGISVIARTTV